jgi:hypothetical protein
MSWVSGLRGSGKRIQSDAADVRNESSGVISLAGDHRVGGQEIGKQPHVIEVGET